MLSWVSPFKVGCQRRSPVVGNTLVFLIVALVQLEANPSRGRPPPPPIPTLHWHAADRPEYGRPRTLATRCYRTIGMCARLERRGGVRISLSQGTVLPTVGKPGPGDIHNRPSVRATRLECAYLPVTFKLVDDVGLRQWCLVSCDVVRHDEWSSLGWTVVVPDLDLVIWVCWPTVTMDDCSLRKLKNKGKALMRAETAVLFNEICL